MRNLAVMAALTAATLGVANGTANAAPATNAYPQKAVHYTISRGDHAAVINATDAQFKVVNDATHGNQLAIMDAKGTTVAAEIPLTYHVDNAVYPIDAKITGHTATLTPSTKPVAHLTGPLPQVKEIHSVAKPIAESFTPRDQQALSALGSRATTSSLTSAVLGAVIGGGLGCLLGGTVATAGATIPTGLVSAGLAALLVGAPAALVGCIAGIATLGSIGTVAGLIFIGGPLILFSAIQYFSTVLSPCSTPGAYCKDPLTATK
jgi:hypothetical protein